MAGDFIPGICTRGCTGANVPCTADCRVLKEPQNER